MNAETRIAALEAENTCLRAEVAAHETIATLSAELTALLERVKELEGQQATDSHNSFHLDMQRRLYLDLAA